MRGAVQSARETMAQQFEAEAMPHVHGLMRAASRLLGDRSKAEDVVQEVFLEAWKSFHRFEPGTNCRAWLYKILFHRVHHLRTKWFRFPLFSEGDESLANLAYTPPIPEQLTDEEMLAALDRLPAGFRAAILLVDIEEFSYKEAAGILGVPAGTVMSRLSRGRRLLREHLAGLAQSYGFGQAKQKGQGV